MFCLHSTTAINPLIKLPFSQPDDNLEAYAAHIFETPVHSGRQNTRFGTKYSHIGFLALQVSRSKKFGSLLTWILVCNSYPWK
jgi:hypothetical protein